MLRRPGNGDVAATILVVEDEDAVRQMLKLTLERAGFVVLDAADGRAALRLAAEARKPFSLVISDLSMPGMGGEEVIKRLRQLMPDTQMLLMSGYADSTTPGELSDIRILGKPFTPRQLLETVRALINTIEA
jgi:CheY-like chemotaxis protein